LHINRIKQFRYMKIEQNCTTTEAWHHWKKACAADLCDAETAAMLRRFGAAKFSAYVKRYASRVGHYGQTMRVAESRDAWHLLETFARVGQTRSGKRYKDWLFQRAEHCGDNWLGAIEGGATLLMRNVVREYLRREHAPAFMTSLNKSLAGESGSTLTLEALLPDTLDFHDELAEREWLTLAKDRAAAIYPSLDSRERIFLWARAQGYPLNDERIVKWTRSGASVNYEVYRKAVERLGLMMKKFLPGESPAVLTHVTCMALAELVQIILSKINQEKGATRFFKKI
jgi:hypothetical protein